MGWSQGRLHSSIDCCPGCVNWIGLWCWNWNCSAAHAAAAVSSIHLAIPPPLLPIDAIDSIKPVGLGGSIAEITSRWPTPSLLSAFHGQLHFIYAKSRLEWPTILTKARSSIWFIYERCKHWRHCFICFSVSSIFNIGKCIPKFTCTNFQMHKLRFIGRNSLPL